MVGMAFPLIHLSNNEPQIHTLDQKSVQSKYFIFSVVFAGLFLKYSFYEGRLLPYSSIQVFIYVLYVVKVNLCL